MRGLYLQGKKYLIFLLVILACFLTRQTVAETRVVLPQIKGWADSDGTGFAFEVYKQIQQSARIDASASVLPFARALDNYSHQEVDCFIGGDKKAAFDYIGKQVIHSAPFLKSKLVIYTPEGNPLVNSSKELYGKTVGIELGTELTILPFEKERVRFHRSKLAANIKMLESGRIFALIDYYPMPYIMRKGLHFNRDLILYEQSDTMHCHENASNHLVIEQFEKGLEVIRKNGKYRTVVEKYFGKDFVHWP